MKVEIVIMFACSLLFTAFIPVGLWAAGWGINKTSIGALCLPTLLWFWYFRLRQIDRKLQEPENADRAAQDTDMKKE